MVFPNHCRRLPSAFTQLQYKEGADSKLRGLYGNGSASTDK
jgi:hypothetical protein